MLNNRSASVKMEEGYMRATIQYSDPSDRAVICDTIGAVERELDLFPEVVHRRKDGTRGSFSVEFGGSDEYVCSRTCGEFIEKLLYKLDITACDDC